MADDLRKNCILGLWVPAFAGTTARGESGSVKQRAVWTTENTARHSRGAIRPSFAHLVTLSENRGRRKGRVAACTRGARAKQLRERRVHHRYRRDQDRNSTRLNSSHV